MGTRQFGFLVLATSAASLLGSLEFGLSMTVIRSSALLRQRRDDADARADVIGAHSAYVALGVITSVALCVLAVALPRFVSASGADRGDIHAVVALIAISVAISSSSAALPGVAAGYNAYGVLALAALTGALAQLAMVLMTVSALGAPGIALAAVAGNAANRAVLVGWVRLRAPWFRMRPARPTRRSLGRLSKFAGPLVAISIISQVMTSTDLYVVGGLVGGTAVALYKVGSLLPTQGIGLLYRGYDTALPLLAASGRPEDQESATVFLVRVASFLGGAALTLLVVLRRPIVILLLGHRSSLAEQVLAVFSLIWMLNIPLHGIFLLLVVRDRHQRLAPYFLTEAALNFGLTIGLVVTIGPVGACLATLATVTVTNVFLAPWVVRRDLDRSPLRIVFADGLARSAVGGCLAAGGALPGLLLVHGQFPRLATAAAGGLAVGVVGGLLLMGPGGRSTIGSMLRRRPDTGEGLMYSPQC